MELNIEANWKKIIALTILKYAGSNPLNEEQLACTLDLEKEHKMIQKKTSPLSRMKRDEIEHLWDVIEYQKEIEKKEIELKSEESSEGDLITAEFKPEGKLLNESE